MVGAKGCFADLRASLACYYLFYPTTGGANLTRHRMLWSSTGAGLCKGSAWVWEVALPRWIGTLTGADESAMNSQRIAYPFSITICNERRSNKVGSRARFLAR